MPDPNSSPHVPAVKRANEYPIATPPATSSLGRILLEKIRNDGPLPFPAFMAAALYHPDSGYYARETHQVGRAGDFFTSVSVGPLFGSLLARRFLREWHELGAPQRWRILECGAHDGTLAADVLTAIRDLDANAFAALEYAIAEPLPRLHAAQQKTLAPFADHLNLTRHPEVLTHNPLPGIVFGNELLDALPFHLVEWHSGEWRECLVTCDSTGNFTWQTDPATPHPRLAAALTPLGENFPTGYRTEIRTNFHDFLEPLTRCISTGIMIWPDYGFARPDYYLPERHRGTLRTFSNHRAAEDPLTTPGEIDITAHVDFTALAEAAISLGATPNAFRNQGSWLTEVGREWLLSLDGQPQPEIMRQFQTLTHPAQLGADFHVLEISWKKPATSTLSAADLHRLALCACPTPTDR